MNTKGETLGQLFLRLRLARGLTQEQVADQAGMPVPSYRNYEYDHRKPDVPTVARLAIVLGATLEQIAATVPADKVTRTPRPAGPTTPRTKQKKRSRDG
jgi:transcriptional regulator with XRE-family HTH domain